MKESVYEDQLREIIMSDPLRRAIAEEVGRLTLNDCWVAAGFVRNIVWDRLHGYSTPTRLNDIDIIYFDPHDIHGSNERPTREQLTSKFPDQHFSVKNQARMHTRNKDHPYSSSAEAMIHWPETCTAVGVKINSGFAVNAPFGLADLFLLKIRPTSSQPLMTELVARRMANKGWLSTWPDLCTVEAAGDTR